MRDFFADIHAQDIAWHSHAFLICGASEPARTLAGYALVDVLFCRDEESKNKPCGKCEGCKARRISSDFVLVEADKSIKTEEIRSLIKQVSIAPMEEKRVVFIKEGSMMTPQAQNALLKTLEEPPRDTVFVISGAETNFLPTIRSRCTPIRLGEQKQIHETPALERAKNIMRSFSPYCQENFAKKLMEEKENLKETLDCLAVLCRDIYASRVGASALAAREAEDTEIDLPGVSQRALQNILELLQETKIMLLGNANPQLAVDALSIKIGREIALR